MNSLLDHPAITERYFFPRTDCPAHPFWVECDGARLACAYHEIDPEAMTVVHFHGNGEVAADYLDGFHELIGHMGCNCFLAEYRGYGGSSGIPQLGRMLEDVAPTIAALGRSDDRIILFGRSVGSLFAIKALESCPGVAGLVLESAIADPLERLLLRVSPAELGTTPAGLAEAVARAIDIKGILSRYANPALLMHTRHDGLIDVSHAERLAAWCAGPTTLEIFDSGNHNDIMFVNSFRYFSLVQEFLAKMRQPHG